MAEKILPGFERFWEAYGYKIGRAAAYKSWVKHKCEDIADEIIAALPGYKAHLQANTWKQQLHASTFINNSRWEDEYPEAKAKPIVTFSKPVEASDYIRPAEITPEQKANRERLARMARETAQRMRATA